LNYEKNGGNPKQKRPKDRKLYADKNQTQITISLNVFGGIAKKVHLTNQRYWCKHCLSQ